MNKKIWFLQQLDLFAGLPLDKLEKIESLFFMREYCKKEVIFEPGDQNKVFIVKTGRVEVYQLNPDGKKVIIEVLKPGSIFGDLGYESQDETYVEATVDSYVCSMDKGVFFSLMSKNPNLSEKLMKNLFNRLILIEKRVSSLAIDNAFGRLIKLLLSLGRDTSKKRIDNGLVELKDSFTHEELAQMVGISRQTMTTLINRLERKGVISRHKKHIMFDKSRLEKLAS